MDSCAFVFAQRVISNVAEWDSSTFGSEIELVQLSPGKFQCQQSLLDFGNLQVLKLSVNQAIAARGTGRTHRFAAVLFDHDQAGHFGGAPIQQHELLILPPFLTFDACAKDRDFGCTVTFLDPQTVQDYYLALTGSELLLTPELTHGMRAQSAAAARLAYCTEQLLLAARTKAPELQEYEYREAMRDEIFMLVTQSLELTSASNIFNPRPRFARARGLVRQAEEHVVKHLHAPVRLIDLCRVTGVSERTLQYAFQEILGMSPIHYLNQVRLHQVRRALSATTAERTTVSAEASRWGFFHFGEFTQAYKALFGELPSDTLQKPRDNAGTPGSGLNFTPEEDAYP